jgi:hypothetical protein
MNIPWRLQGHRAPFAGHDVAVAVSLPSSTLYLAVVHSGYSYTGRGGACTAHVPAVVPAAEA